MNGVELIAPVNLIQQKIIKNANIMAACMVFLLPWILLGYSPKTRRVADSVNAK